LKEKECYDVLSVGLLDLIKEMEESKTIKVDNNIYEIEYSLGGDWTFWASDWTSLAFACIVPSAQNCRGITQSLVYPGSKVWSQNI
ncbi:Hypothetical predicted protein, partial [Paramuricea clavata]